MLKTSRSAEGGEAAAGALVASASNSWEKPNSASQGVASGAVVGCP